MERIYRAVVSLTVPVRRPSGRIEWVSAPEVAATLLEFVRSPDECGPLVVCMGNIVARRLAADSTLTGFRVSARGVTTKALCGLAEWSRATTRDQFVRVFEWHATWADLPPTAPATAAYTAA
jgi:hypothetical protein